MAFTIIFLVEAVIKIIAHGFVMNGKYSYLRKSWNQLDFFIVVASVLDMALSSIESLSIVRVLRVLRILRPIRIVARNQNLQIALSALIKSMPKIVKLQLLTAFFIFMLAIVQTHMYSGSFHSCYTAHLDLKNNQLGALIHTQWECLNYGGEWIKPDFNYDTIGESYLTLQTLASNEGWIQVLWDTVDAVGPFQEKQRDANRYFASVYTIVVLFIISLLFLNLFIGVVIETFNR